mgnify:CR=1 FL=1
MYDFTNQVALVTGASRGIGNRVAEKLAYSGARVVLVSRTEADVEECAERIRQNGGDAMAFGMDVSQIELVSHYADIL